MYYHKTLIVLAGLKPLIKTYFQKADYVKNYSG